MTHGSNTRSFSSSSSCSFKTTSGHTLIVVFLADECGVFRLACWLWRQSGGWERYYSLASSCIPVQYVPAPASYFSNRKSWPRPLPNNLHNTTCGGICSSKCKCLENTSGPLWALATAKPGVVLRLGLAERREEQTLSGWNWRLNWKTKTSTLEAGRVCLKWKCRAAWRVAWSHKPWCHSLWIKKVIDDLLQVPRRKQERVGCNKVCIFKVWGAARNQRVSVSQSHPVVVLSYCTQPLLSEGMNINNYSSTTTNNNNNKGYRKHISEYKRYSLIGWYSTGTGNVWS